MRAVAVQAIGSMLVSAYLLVGSFVVTLTFFGEQPSATALRQATWMRWGFGLSLVVGVASAYLVMRAHRSLGPVRPHRSWPLVLATGWAAGLVPAALSLVLLPNLYQPVGFGLVWLTVGAVVGPLVVIAKEPRSS